MSIVSWGSFIWRKSFWTTDWDRAFDDLSADVHFQELSQSRAGYGVNIDLADELIERLIGHRAGQSVHPTTSDRRCVDDLRRFLLAEQLSSVGTMIDLDLTYMKNLRGFMAELSDIGEAVEREQHLLERREEIADEARRLQKRARSDLRRNLIVQRRHRRRYVVHRYR